MHAEAPRGNDEPLAVSTRGSLDTRPAVRFAGSNIFATSSLSTSPPGADLQATNIPEVAMPEDGNGSGLISLFWGLWLYWFLSSWSDYLSSLAQVKKPQQPGQSLLPAAISAPGASAECEELEALVSRILGRCGIAVNDFLNERLAVYESIVTAFDAGDRRTLCKHVSPEVYGAFSEAIAAREGRQEKTETQFAQIAPPKIVAALFDEAHAEISIRFVADSYRLTGRASGRPVERAPDKQHSIDVWTFGCTSPTNEWLLIATEAGT